jgi:hypothetical protein
MVLLCIAIGVLVVLKAFAGVKLPRQMLGFTFVQLNLIVSILVAVTLLTFFVLDTLADKGAGLIIMMLAAIGMVVGAFMQHSQSSSAYGPYG